MQEWLNLWRFVNPAWKYIVAVDGDYGRQTDKVVRYFQEQENLPVDGVVGKDTYKALTKPMMKAFSRIEGANLADLVVAYAEQQLANHPTELPVNRGPWVRAYMDGHEGNPWAWCVGFVQTVLDQAFFTLDENVPFTSLMPSTYGCDDVAKHGRQTKRLVTNAELKKNSSLVSRGDVFLVLSPTVVDDWTHTGIVTGVSAGEGLIHTIEGNTNEGGSREGLQVCKRIRSFQDRKIDIFRTKPKLD